MLQGVEEDEGIKAVHEAFNSGINYFDTSPWYGELRAEIVSFAIILDLRLVQTMKQEHYMSMTSRTSWDFIREISAPDNQAASGNRISCMVDIVKDVHMQREVCSHQHCM